MIPQQASMSKLNNPGINCDISFSTAEVSTGATAHLNSARGDNNSQNVNVQRNVVRNSFEVGYRSYNRDENAWNFCSVLRTKSARRKISHLSLLLLVFVFSRKKKCQRTFEVPFSSCSVLQNILNCYHSPFIRENCHLKTALPMRMVLFCD